MTTRKYNVLSLGAGVQSSTLALMAAKGEITPMPDFAVFADTQAEPQSVYDWLDWLESQLPFPVHRVSKGDLRKAATTMHVTKDGRSFSKTGIPSFVMNEDDGSTGKIPHRTCTRDYKILPIHKAIRKLCGIKRGQKTVTVTQWIGISIDEIRRAKESRERWSVHRWPLIENRMTRLACLDWMRGNGYPEPPRSACTFCPFHGNTEWRRMQQDEPEAFADAVKFEKELQAIKAHSEMHKSKPFLHRSCKPLDEVDFRSDIEKGQLPLWQDECEGMCGV